MMKNIVFDLGGVLTNLDYQLTNDGFRRLGFPDFDKMYSQFTANNLFANFEMGKISSIDFLNTLQAQHPDVTHAQLIAAWNAMLLNFRNDVLPFLLGLKNRYRLFLLSNTNAIHIARFKEIFTECTGEASIDVYFEKAWYSHLIHYRKPNDDVYQFICTDASIKPEETLFVDDSYPNIDAAKNLGFRTHLLKSGERIQDLNYD